MGYGGAEEDLQGQLELHERGYSCSHMVAHTCTSHHVQVTITHTTLTAPTNFLPLYISFPSSVAHAGLIPGLLVAHATWWVLSFQWSSSDSDYHHLPHLTYTSGGGKAGRRCEWHVKSYFTWLQSPFPPLDPTEGTPTHGNWLPPCRIEWRLLFGVFLFWRLAASF